MTKITLLLCLLLTISLQAKPKITFDEKIKSVQTKGIKYFKYKQSKEKQLEKAEARNLAKKILDYTRPPINKIVPEALAYQEDELEVINLDSDEDPTSYLNIDTKSGDIKLNGGFKRYQQNASTPRLLKEEKAKKKLMEHLEKLGIKVNKKEISNLEVGGLSMATQYEDGTVDKFEKFTVVRAYRKLNNLPVLGASRIVARLSEDGDLHSLVYRWVDVGEFEATNGELIADEDLLDANSVESKVSKKLDKYQSAKEIKVKRKDIIMYDDGQGTIEPVVFVYGKSNYATNNGDDVEGTIDFYVPILINSELVLPNDDNVIPLPKN